jgi:hypothetical protein
MEVTPRERFIETINFRKPDDRLPMIEWAAWWDKTTQRWHEEGLHTTDRDTLIKYFGLDDLLTLLVPTKNWEGMPVPAYHGAPLINDEAEYDAIHHDLFTDENIEQAKQNALEWKDAHDRGDFGVRIWLDGFFWFPRTLLGIKEHFLAFYENPELIHRMNRELADHSLRALEEIFSVLKPDMVGFAEDMSYNNGPMLSHDMYKEFILPYYNKLIPYIKSHGIKVLVDSDGKVDMLIPWLLEAGVDGIYPLERQAGVDVAALRKKHPNFIMLGGYDKMVMSKGEAAMKAEFERLLPVLKQGGFVPSVDHQTPPEVSLENYRIYIKLFEEYCRRAVE